MVKKRALSFFCFLSCSIMAIPTNMVIVDNNFSPYVGAKNLLLIHEGLQKIEDWALQSTHPTNNPWEQTIGRFLELAFIWHPINHLTMLVQHEVFGHGFMVRSLHEKIAYFKNYYIALPPPYGKGNGHTNFVPNLKKFTIYEDIAITIAGVEASAILAKQIKLSWITKGWINPKQASLYIKAQGDLSEYIAWTPPHSKKGDISRYISSINTIYCTDALSIEKLLRWSWINFLDPMTLYSIFSDIHYISKGGNIPIPMISIGSYKYLPNFRFGLTPFGPEWYFENFLVKGEQPIYFYLKNGSCGNTSYFGAGMEHNNLFTSGWGLKFDCWIQPFNDFNNQRYSIRNLLENDEKILPRTTFENPFGFALSITMQTKKLWSENAYLYAELGGKTAGYLAGEPIQQSIIARIGLNLW